MIRVVAFHPDGSHQAGGRALLDELPTGTPVWIDVEGQTEGNVQFVESLGYHPMAIKDCFTLHHQPKVEDYEDCLFIIVRGIDFNKHDKKLETLKLAAFLNAERLVTFHRAPLRSVQIVWNRLEGASRCPPGGLPHLLYLVYEEMMGLFFPVVDEVGTELEKLEEQVFQTPREEQLMEVLEMKQRLAAVRRVMLPHRQVFNHLGSGTAEEIPERETVFYRDVYDDVVRLTDAVDVQRDQLSSVRDTYLSVIGQRTNEIMKVLTVISAVLLPLTVIAGIYGMNFEFMPELHSKLGYPFALGTMAVVAGGMLAYFRSKKWI